MKNPYWKGLLFRARPLTKKSERSLLARRKRASLAFEPLEDRCVPAFLLQVSMDGGAHFGSPISDGGTGTINAAIAP